MERWEVLYNDSVDTIKFRQAGGMYNDIARKAFKAGVDAGKKEAESLCIEHPEGKTQCLSEQQK